MSLLKVQNITKTYKKTKVLDAVSFEMSNNEIIALLGESGSGKSTLLRIIAGFEEPELGEVFLDNKLLVGPNAFVKPEKRDVGMIFQDYALFPHLTVEQNIGFGVRSADGNRRVAELIELFELKDQLNKRPAKLSGGQQQRVAIARALAAKPSVLLLDEPFSNLDQSLRRKVRAEIKRVNVHYGIPLIMVSHDPEDALELADRIAVIKDGVILQIDTPEQLYKNPVNEYVGSLFGYISIWKDGQLLRPEKLCVVDGNSTSDTVKAKIINVVFHTSGQFLIQAQDETSRYFHFFHEQKLDIGTQVFIREK